MSSNKGEALALFAFLFLGLSGILISPGVYNSIPDLLLLKSSDVKYGISGIYILPDNSSELNGISNDMSQNLILCSNLIKSPIAVHNPDVIKTSLNNKTHKIVAFEKDILNSSHDGWNFNNSSKSNMYKNSNIDYIYPEIDKFEKPSPEVKETAVIWRAKAVDPEGDKIYYQFRLNRDLIQPPWDLEKKATFNAMITFNKESDIMHNITDGNLRQEFSLIIVISSCIIIIICIIRMLWKG
jgi:hypothetical protein